MTWDSALDLFLADLLKRGRKTSTVTTYRYDLSLFISWIEKRLKMPPEDVLHSFDTNILEFYLKAFRKERGASISNVKRVRGVLINFLQFHGSA
ncbi:tyrosine-type recombinase/integrase, partial [Bacillus thuringiensis]